MEEQKELTKLVIDRDFISKRPLSYSSLKQFRKSPQHYVNYLEKKFTPTPAMMLGSVFDVLLLTPEKFDKTYMVTPDINKRTKAGKIEWEQAVDQAKSKGLVMIQEDVLKTAKKMKESLMNNPDGAEMIDNMIKSQVRLSWKDTSTKLPLIGYLDFETLYRGQHTIVDLKTAADAEPSAFMRSALNLDYWLQAAMYSDAFHKTKYKFPQFMWLVVETKAPFGVSIIKITDHDMAWAKEEMIKTLQAFKYSLDNNQFNRSYEFTLFDTLPYHLEELPKYKKSIYG